MSCKGKRKGGKRRGLGVSATTDKRRRRSKRK